MLNMKSLIEQICIEKGVKITEPRKVIAKVMSEATDHPHVEEIYLRANKIDSKISLATVYRTINMLEGYGIIEKLEFGDGKARYEVTSNDDDHHHHLIDMQSGRIIEFCDIELEELKQKIAHRLGYKLIAHRLELYGVPIKHKDNVE